MILLRLRSPAGTAFRSFRAPILRQCRFSSHASTPAQKAKAAQSTKHDLPAVLLIYHAGTGRTTFLAMLKLTSLIVGSFFGLLVVPSYIKADKPRREIAAACVCGVLPILFIAYTTAPFVTHMHVHLPDAARSSTTVLQRFVASMPPSTPLTVTTMSAIGKPRYSSVTVGELKPARGRLGVANYHRETREENADRRWYMYRAVGDFYVQEGARKKVRDKDIGKRGVVDSWIWDAIRERVQRQG